MIKNHKLFRIFLLLWFVRILGTIFFFLRGSTLEEISVQNVFLSVAWQTGELLLLYVLFYYLGCIKWIKMVIYLIIGMLFLILASWSILDPIIMSLAGDRLTPSLLAHFAGPQIFLSDELWLPIKENAIIVIFGLVLVTIVTRFLVRYLIQAYHQKFKVIYTSQAGLLLLATMLMVGSWGIQPDYFIYPPEFAFIRNALGWDRFVPDSKDIKELRSFYGHEGPEDYPDFPLVHRIGNSNNSVNKPNIVLLVIESFRAASFQVYNPDSTAIELPGMNKFARRAKVFPYMISNGFPSTEGFSSLAMGVPPHSKERLVITHQEVALPSLACALKQNSYQTFRVETDLDLEEESYWVLQTFDSLITYEQTFPSAQVMLEDVGDLLLESKKDSRPVFVHVKTRNPHYPYEIADDENQRFYTLGTPEENYMASMRVVDQKISDFYDFLEKENLLDNTVVIITGDHSNYLSKTHVTGLPTDETVWVGGLISGPEPFIGRPEVVQAHASLLDIPTTILSLVSQKTDWVIFGKDLLHAPSFEGTSMAIRPSGIRYNNSKGSFMVSRSNPSTLLEIVSFGALPIVDSPEHQSRSYSAEELLRVADTWSYLLDTNQVFPENSCQN